MAAPHGISGVEESGKSTFNYRTRWEENIFHSFFFRNSNFLPGTLSSLFLPSSPLSFFSVTRALSKHVYLIILHMHSLACRSFARALKQWSGSVVMNTNRLRSVFLWYFFKFCEGSVRILRLNSHPLRHWREAISKLTWMQGCDVSSRVSGQTKRTNLIWICIWFGDTTFAIFP